MFRKLFAALPLVAVTLCWTCCAQDFVPRRDGTIRPQPLSDTSLGMVTPTPEMWFYEQERSRYDDTKMAIRRRAEARGQQRADRLASMKWFGYSNSRPTVTPTPWFTSYSEHWGSNSYDPQRWRLPAVPLIVVRPGTERY